MPVRFLQPDKYGLYFITFTCHRWLHLIEITKSYDLVYKWFDYLNVNGNYIVGYVIMPNHIHALIAFANSRQSINTRVGNGKRFLAYGIVERLKQADDKSLLQILTTGVNRTDKLRGKIHEVFEPSFDCKECRSYEFINQKLEYIHLNPCRGKWTLAENAADYIHSSAKYYISGIQGIYSVTHYRKLEDIDLSVEMKK